MRRKSAIQKSEQDDKATKKKEPTRLELTHQALDAQIKTAEQMIKYEQGQLAKVTPLNDMWRHYTETLAGYQAEFGAATIAKQALSKGFGDWDVTPWVDLILGAAAAEASHES